MTCICGQHESGVVKCGVGVVVCAHWLQVMCRLLDLYTEYSGANPDPYLCGILSLAVQYITISNAVYYPQLYGILRFKCRQPLGSRSTFPTGIDCHRISDVEQRGTNKKHTDQIGREGLARAIRNFQKEHFYSIKISKWARLGSIIADIITRINNSKTITLIQLRNGAKYWN